MSHLHPYFRMQSLKFQVFIPVISRAVCSEKNLLEYDLPRNILQRPYIIMRVNEGFLRSLENR